ncbi:MAG: ketoacyl-ACP synthase III [Gammaproteobacteria bacterium]|nr:ketoacyl-ACP synthase III [Gammaproteobacteria bacterium]MCH9744530.1 ketoacyl-ACP synthase III [Gammaproteobacteria bacterium]
MPYSKIAGTGSYLPEKILTNQDLEKMVDTTDEWIMQRVGVRERHIVADSGDTTCSMATEAARRAIQDAGVQVDDIDMVIVGTASPDYYFPSAACIIQKNLGIENDCAAFDLNAACAGFVYSLNMADLSIRCGEAKTVLIVGVDTLTTVVDWTDRSTCVLFGDGAGAVVLQASDEPGILTSNIHAAGRYAKSLYAKNALWKEEDAGVLNMDGREVFKVAVKKLDEIVDQTLAKAGVEKSQIDWLIPHQANVRIIQAVAKRLELSMERVIMTIEHHANTSAASIPLALDHALKENKIKRGDLLMLEAFGAGLAWGATLVRY